MRDYRKGNYRIKESYRIWYELLDYVGADKSKLRIRSGGKYHMIVYNYRFLGYYDYVTGAFHPAR